MMTPEQFRELAHRVFVRNPDGKQVLEYLAANFYDCTIFAKGGNDGDRQTAFNAGRREVVSFIFKSIAITEDNKNE